MTEYGEQCMSLPWRAFWVVDVDPLLTLDLENAVSDLQKLGLSEIYSHKFSVGDVLFLPSRSTAVDEYRLNKAVKNIRSNCDFYLPTFVIANEYDENEEVQAFELGVDDYLSYPINQPFLLNRLKVIAYWMEKLSTRAEQQGNIDFQSCKIAIIEDDPRDRFIYEQVLRGYDLTLYHSVAEAQQNLDNLAAMDLIIVDVMLGDGTGYQLVSQFRQQGILSSKPIVFSSALNRRAEIAKGFELGVIDYISKPINPKRLSAKVQYWLTHYV